jgi:hypothetical protein
MEVDSMKKKFLKVFTLALFAPAAVFGTTVTVSLGSNAFPNGGSAPYVGTVGGVTTNLVCDDEFDVVYPNESWTATVLTLSNLNASNYTTTRFGSNYSLSVATKLYDEVAYLALQFASNPTADWAAIQTALWQVFDPSVSNVGTTGATSSSFWSSQATSNYASVASQASRIEILTPVAGTQTHGYGLPQEFIVITGTPEPATYTMFGAGLLLLSLGTFRKRNRKQQ